MADAMTNEERLNLRRHYAGPSFLREGFRPLFLGAALWAAIAVPLWISVWTGLIAYRGAFGPVAWHIHEMVFGFVAAAIGGFLLTAVPNWTGRLPVRGAPLAGLALLWLAGRIAVWFAGDIAPVAAAVADLLYLFVLGAFLANEILAGRNWRNLPVLAAGVLLIAANVLFHLPALDLADTGETAVRLSVSVVVLLIALIGGRVVPSFTRNWFARNDGPEIASPMTLFDRATLLVSLVALVLWIADGDPEGTGIALTVAGVFNLIRLARWRGWHTGREPLVTVLHAGYLWLGLGLLALGASLWSGRFPPSAALHVLTIGAMGTMILAVTTRAILGHTGRALRAGPGTVTIYGLVTLAVMGRVAFEFVPDTLMLWLAAAGWSGGFGLFVILYGPMLFRPREDSN